MTRIIIGIPEMKKMAETDKETREKVLVTSALPYANGPIHFGHIAGAYLGADIYVRFKKMCGADIIYMCGTDDHGVAITISAEAAGRSPEEHVSINHALIKSIFNKMNIDFTNFSQTSNPTNHSMSQHFFKRLVENGLIVQKETEQLYSRELDLFLADRYVEGTCPHCGYEKARGDECGSCGAWLDALELIDPKCKVNGEKPEVRKTKNWFLKLEDRAEWLEGWLNEMQGRAELPWKKLVVSEIQGYLKRGLESRAITRDLKWGVKLPQPYTEDGKVLYVWFDAPIGYISSTIEYFARKSEEDPGNYSPDMWKDYWQNPDCKLVHFIGKDNIPFHAMIFPIMLQGVDEGYILPDFIAGNAFLNLEGRQFSKSEGWYIEPLEFLEKYPTDSLRYYLCSDMPESTDSEFQWDRFQQAHNGELTNIYANLVNRTLKFISTKLDGKVPSYKRDWKEEQWVDNSIHNKIMTAPGAIGELYLNRFMFRRGLQEMMILAREGNQYFDSRAPWKALTEDRAECEHTIRTCLRLIKTMAVVSCPFIPETAQRVWAMLGLEGNVADCKWCEAAVDTFRDGARLPEPEPLFKKIDNKQIAREKKKLGGGAEQPKKKQKKQSSIPGIKKFVEFDDFAKVDLRAGRILEAENIEGSFKMLKLKVDIGLEQRQIIAGIAKQFKPEDLKGRTIIVVANLEPKKLMGLESQGMLLAAGGKKDLQLLTVTGDVAPGTRVS